MGGKQVRTWQSVGGGNYTPYAATLDTWPATACTGAANSTTANGDSATRARKAIASESNGTNSHYSIQQQERETKGKGQICTLSCPTLESVVSLHPFKGPTAPCTVQHWRPFLLQPRRCQPESSPPPPSPPRSGFVRALIYMRGKIWPRSSAFDARFP